MENKTSMALEFAAKVLFEYGPMMRTERKSKGDKAIRFRFPYTRTYPDEPEKKAELSIKVVIVTTFKDVQYTKSEEDGKMLLTFRQAGLLAIITFSKAIEFCYNHSSAKLLTPLCGAIFSRDAISDMSKDLGIEEVLYLKIINESSASRGQYLPNSDLACAVVCMITATRRVTDKAVRDSMISKVVKQYIHCRKIYEETRFIIFSKYALGGVPPGLDSSTLIEL